jgi:aspartate/methionine/tyrosine aminotransferase
MRYPRFELEHYLAAREFSAPFNLCSSDLESFSMREIVELADTECAALWDQLRLSYTEPRGLPQLRAEISKEYALTMDEVLCFAGAEEGIYCMAQALLTPGDHAIVVTPCYQSLEALPASVCPVTSVPLRYEEQWQLDIQAVEQAVRPNTKLLVINFPHNPTGALLTCKQQQDLIELARSHDLWIFSDEVYRFLESDAADRLPPIASAYEKGLSLGVMSKAYGLAGLRVGWIACQDRELLEKLSEIKHYLSICNSAPSEVLALIALRTSDTLLTRNQELMQSNLLLLDHFFEEYAEWFEWVRPKGGCIGFPLFKGNDSIDLFADRLLQEEGVLILPGSVYGLSGNHFRIGFGRRSTPEALGRFRCFAKRFIPFPV